ncbi:nuclease-related domain-containing protein [uncultured Jatrophihabitans sp.]|uniref:nuclease-related domain-containing protein n=1 Tax=uncultured Jatrophihabitans sp. TaxID=1610747 RepID=UPI0035CA8159
MALRRPGMCSCGQTLAAGERAAWDKSRRVVLCLSCAAGALPLSATEQPEVAVLEPAPIDLGVAGGSARAEFERRHQKREDRVREAHPKIGGLLLALFDDPQSTQAWRKGGVGEQKVGERFAKLGDSVIALHDRCVPRSRANIDHIVIGPSGVFVVDTKRYAGAKVALRRSGGFLSPYREQLMVRGRDQTKMVEAMEWQLSAVRTALSGSPFADVPISAVLCFVDGELPFSGKIDIGDVRVRGPKGCGRLVAEDGPLDAAEREQIAQHLAERLPAKKMPTT